MKIFGLEVLFFLSGSPCNKHWHSSLLQKRSKKKNLPTEFKIRVICLKKHCLFDVHECLLKLWMTNGRGWSVSMVIPLIILCSSISSRVSCPIWCCQLSGQLSKVLLLVYKWSWIWNIEINMGFLFRIIILNILKVVDCHREE